VKTYNKKNERGKEEKIRKRHRRPLPDVLCLKGLKEAGVVNATLHVQVPRAVTAWIFMSGTTNKKVYQGRAL
jgi:hypothetical protein